MLRQILLVLLLASASACAQSSTLPEAVLGEWQPYGEGYRQFGDLSIAGDTLSWGNCRQARYRVYRWRDSTYYVELLHSPPCKFGFEASFLVVVMSDRGIEVSICRERDEFDRPATERFCARGLLTKKQAP